MDDEDPTIICNILKDFRKSADNYYRSSVLPLNVANERKTDRFGKSRQLEFNDSLSGQLEVPEKKMKLMTPNNSEGAAEVMSPWEIRRLKTETFKSKAQLIEAEERISKLEGLKLETELHYAREKKVLEDMLNQERNKVTELENRLKFVRKREADAIDRISQLKTTENSKDSSFKNALLEMQKENQNLKEQVFELQNKIESSKNEENAKLDAIKTELELQVNNAEMNAQLIKDLRNEISEKNTELRKLEIEQTKLLNATKRVKDLESERQTYLETKSYVELQNKKLLQFSRLEKELEEMKEENKRLKSSISNTMLLEEMVENLQSRQSVMPSLEQDNIKLRSENESQRIELDKWSNLAKHYCGENGENLKPLILVTRRLEELVRKELWYVSENKNLEIKVDHLKKKLLEKETEMSKLKHQEDSLRASCETHAANIRRLKKSLALIVWERNDLRSLLDSYQKDVTINSEVHNPFDSLQKVIDGYKERMAQLESDPLLAVPSGIGSVKPLSLNSEKEELVKREAALTSENKKLQERIQYLNDQLEYRQLKGDFDPRQTKIIHLKSNPSSEALHNYEDRLLKANEEVLKLRERIRAMEEGNNQDLTRIVEERVETNSTKEINELRERVKSFEIQNQRLVEAFKKRTQDFREAVYLLLGYKLDFLPHNQFRACSQYAYDSQDFLMFQMSQGGGGMELLGTPYSETLAEFVDLHLKQHNSIPLFLASLTVDLFNKQSCITSYSTIETTLCNN